MSNVVMVRLTEEARRELRAHVHRMSDEQGRIVTYSEAVLDLTGRVTPGQSMAINGELTITAPEATANGVVAADEDDRWLDDFDPLGQDN
jgi:hypothetical protein